ncbi:flagellar M-ring protein FliF C-terminal domain-containing protein [Kamptonema cortianum]|nr:flagellar M-ring protein FliF C-terminal domain-containing protein [Geitlerinema splendidum]MDK3158348.1 flagellar M-ring protein FliF C-terminal domain-containing protein [Kamptonema cortianum]
MGAIIDRIRTWWLTADKTQKLVTGFGTAFLAVVLFLTVNLAGKPNMQPVVPGLADTERAAVYEELTKGGFRAEVTPEGEVVVPKADVPRAKMHLANKNKLPSGGGSSLQLIDSLSPMDSQAKERQKLQAALERELADSILTMDGVSGAQVHLQAGKDSAFGDQTMPPSATVRITESNAGSLNSEAAKAIARLVQNAVTGLKGEDVSVVSTTGRIIYDGKDENSTTSLATRKMEAEVAEGRRRAAELQRELDVVFGPGNTIVQVDVQLNMDSIAIQKSSTIRSGDPVTEETAKETMTSAERSNASLGGVEGNNPAGGGGISGSSDSNNYSTETKSRQYPTSTENTQTEKAAGELVSMNVSVMANSAIVKDVAPLQQRISAYVAPWKGNPLFQTNVTTVEFSTVTAESQSKAQAAAASAAKMQQMISLLPVGALIVVALFLMKSLTKTLQNTSTRELQLSNGETIRIPVKADPQLMAMIETVDNSGSRPTEQIAEYEEIEEETGEYDDEGEPIVVRKKKKKRRIHDDDDDDDEVDVASIKRKVDVPLEQIRKMSKRNPEAVATLLKDWMSDEAK